MVADGQQPDVGVHARSGFERVDRVRLLPALQAVRRVYDSALGVQRYPGARRLLPFRRADGGQLVQVHEPLAQRLFRLFDGGRHRFGYRVVRQGHVLAVIVQVRRQDRSHGGRLQAHLVVADRRRDDAHRRYAAGVDGGLDPEPLHPVDAFQVGTLGHLQVDGRVRHRVHRRTARVVPAVRRIAAAVFQARPGLDVDHQTLLLVPGHVLLGQPGRGRFRLVVQRHRVPRAVRVVPVGQRAAVRYVRRPFGQLATTPFRHVGRRDHQRRAHRAGRTRGGRSAAASENVVLALGRRRLETGRERRRGVQSGHRLRRVLLSERLQAAVHVERRVVALGVARIRGTGFAFVTGHRTSPVVSRLRASAATTNARPENEHTDRVTTLLVYNYNNHLSNSF